MDIVVCWTASRVAICVEVVSGAEKNLEIKI